VTSGGRPGSMPTWRQDAVGRVSSELADLRCGSRGVGDGAGGEVDDDVDRIALLATTVRVDVVLVVDVTGVQLALVVGEPAACRVTLAVGRPTQPRLVG